MFEDEARFGRMSNPLRCWAPAGCRPEVPTHRVREYTHVFGSVSPQDGELISLILPHADTAAMSLYLAEVSRRHPDEHILMFMDRAGWHQAKALVVPDNLTVDWLPPYSPQCNPQELVWREVRPPALWQPRLRFDGRGPNRVGTPPPPVGSLTRSNPIPHRL